MATEPINETLYAQAQALAQSYHDFMLNEGTLSDGSIMWMAIVRDMPHCMAQGRTPNKAIKACREALVDYLYFGLLDGAVTLTGSNATTVTYTTHFEG